MIGIASYIVRVGPVHNTTGPFSVDAGADAIPISGEIVSAPPGRPGKPGDPVWFQYNATLDPDNNLQDDLYMIPPDMLYRIGEQMANDWIFFELEGEVFDGARKGRVISSSHSIYTPGKAIVSARGLSHRLVPKMFSSVDIYAVKGKYVVFYID